MCSTFLNDNQVWFWSQVPQMLNFLTDNQLVFRSQVPEMLPQKSIVSQNAPVIISRIFSTFLADNQVYPKVIFSQNAPVIASIYSTSICSTFLDDNQMGFWSKVPQMLSQVDFLSKLAFNSKHIVDFLGDNQAWFWLQVPKMFTPSLISYSLGEGGLCNSTILFFNFAMRNIPKHHQ